MREPAQRDTLYLEVTNRGALWPRAPGDEPVARDAADLRIADIERLLEPLHAVERVVFSGPGDPLLHPRVAYLVRATRGCGPAVAVETTADVLEGRLIHDLFEAGLDELRIQLFAWGRGAYRRLRGEDRYRKVADNLESFASSRHMALLKDPRLTLCFWGAAAALQPPRRLDRLLRRFRPDAVEVLGGLDLPDREVEDEEAAPARADQALARLRIELDYVAQQGVRVHAPLLAAATGAAADVALPPRVWSDGRPLLAAEGDVFHPEGGDYAPTLAAARRTGAWKAASADDLLAALAGPAGT
jgi:hypothetical protein